MIHVDLSPKQNLILPTSTLSWSYDLSHNSAPPTPPDAISPSPIRDRSSSLSPVPDNPSPMKPDDDDLPSRQSTPLTDLSPPPDHDPLPQSDSQIPDDVEKPSTPDNPIKSNSPSAHNVSTSSTLATPQAPRSTASPALSDSKVVTILELNAELLKVSIEFQTRGIPMTESRFQQFAIRLQSNLTWLAVAADQNLQGSHTNTSLPPMDPPPIVDFVSTERIQQLYADLPALFANEIARRHALNNKRDRSDEPASDNSRKRRDTGESKSSSMPPPAVPSVPSPAHTHFSLPLSNGVAPPAPSPSPSMVLPSLPSGPTEAQVAASSRERARQVQIRQAIQQQQQQQQVAQPMSPLASGSGPAPHQAGQSQQHPVTDPSSITNPTVAAALAALGPNAAQNLRSLQDPSHPFVQYMTTAVPGFLSLTVQQQLQRMQFVQAAIQARNQQQQQQNQGSAQQRGGGSSNPSSGNSQYSGQNAPPEPPVSHQAPMAGLHGQSQNPMFPLGNQRDNSVTDPRLGVPNAQTHPNGVNLNNLTPQQRQFLLQHQQQLMSARGGNPQQAYAFQERIRQEQHRAQAHQAGSPTHAGSPLALPTNESFPVLRSNSAIPGIARSTRSPSESAPSPVAPRAPARGPSLGQEDYQRMMQAQQQQQRGQFHQQMQQPSNWPQQGQMGPGQGSSYGMSPPGSAGHGTPYGVPSPTNSQNNWPQGPSGRYPFSPPPGAGHQSERVHTPRHMSSTPGPQQQMHSQNNSPPVEQSGLNDFDLFNNWT